MLRKPQISFLGQYTPLRMGYGFQVSIENFIISIYMSLWDNLKTTKLNSF